MKKPCPSKPMKMLALCLATAGGCSLYMPFEAFHPDDRWAFRWALWLVLCLCLAVPSREKINRRLLRYIAPLSFALAASLTIGAQLQVYDSFSFQPASLFKGCLCMLGLWSFCFQALACVFSLRPAQREALAELSWCDEKRLTHRGVFWLCFALFCAVSIVWITAYYPFILNYDGDVYIEQTILGNYNDFLVLAYMLLIRAVLVLRDAFGLTDAQAFLLLSLVQMLVMGSSLSYGVSVLYRHHANRWLTALAVAYVCFFPLFGYFVCSTTKDVLFSSFILLTGIEVFRLVREKPSGASLVRQYLRFALFAVLMCQFRQTGLVALVLISVALTVWAFRANKKSDHRARKAVVMAVVCAGTLAIQFLLGNSLFSATGAEKSIKVRKDMMSLPAQQLARVLRDSDDKEEIKLINSTRFFFYLETIHDIGDRYLPHFADPAKNCYQMLTNEEYQKALPIWFQIGLRNPRTYLEAFLELTRGLWYIDDQSYADIYGTGQATIAPGLQRPSSAFSAFTGSMDAFFSNPRLARTPLLRYLFCPAVQAWLIMICLCYAGYRRKRASSMFLLYAVFHLLPLFFHPCIITRYCLQFYMMGLPFGLLSLSVPQRE